MLAKRGIRGRASGLADDVFERINRAAVEASARTFGGKKEVTPYFEGSDWQTGAYFEKRAIPRRNGVRWRRRWRRRACATVPAGRCANQFHQHPFRHHRRCDPLMKRFSWRRKGRHAAPRCAGAFHGYLLVLQNAHTIDQKWSVRACGVRQRHIDQAQSVNLYITNEYTLRQVLELYVLAWEVRRQDRYTMCAQIRWRWRNAGAAPPEAALCGRNGQEEPAPYRGGKRRKSDGDAGKNRCSTRTETPTSRLRRMIGGNTTNPNDFNNMRYSWVSGWHRQAMNNFWIPERRSAWRRT